jgi:hypothetical protein
METMPKILIIMGIILIAFCFVIPGSYDACHSDLIISGYNDSQNCFPDFVYQLRDASGFIGLGCLSTVAIDAIVKADREES